jgi:hypothetical protein
MMRSRRKVKITLGAMMATAFLVLGIPLSASAKIYNNYWGGGTIQNQIKSSTTVPMDGGRAVQPTLVTNARITQVGVGSNEGGTVAELTHTTTTTYSYCQWRAPENFGSELFTLICDYIT